MKKFLSALMVLFAVAIFLPAMTYAANRYDDDPDYVYVASFVRGRMYLYLPSVDVQEYNPPHYQIAGTFVRETGSSWEVVLRYNWYTKEIFRRDEYGRWKKQDITDGQGKSFNIVYDRKIADALFRAAYGMDFYGY